VCAQSNAYDPFAEAYRRQFAPSYLPFAVRIIKSLVLPVVGRSASIADFGCGSGELAGLLAAEGFRVTGVDCSHCMIELARKRCPEAKFVEADIRTDPIDPPCNAVLAVGDVVSHLAPGDLPQAFNVAAASLEPGGVFVFDIGLLHGFSRRWRGSFTALEADVVVAGQATFDRAARRGDARYSIFTKSDGGAWQRKNVEIAEWCHSESYVRRSLRLAGFGDVERFTADEIGWPPGAPAGMAFYRAAKA
jgi:SAM-dependent methyltransferase